MCGVEIAGRLVGQENRRIDRQRARDGDALALAARQLVGQMLQPVTELHERRAAPRARSSTFARGQPRRCSGRPTFSRHDSVGSRLKNWKMNPILSRRTRVSSSSDSAGERLAVDADLAGGRAIEAADEVEQRRLAGAGRADDRDHLATWQCVEA